MGAEAKSYLPGCLFFLDILVSFKETLFSQRVDCSLLKVSWMLQRNEGMRDPCPTWALRPLGESGRGTEGLQVYEKCLVTSHIWQERHMEGEVVVDEP